MLIFLCKNFQCHPNKSMTVIIIGAGVAGLFLAEQLPGVVVLEASQRPGGRISTQHGKDGVELERGPWRIAETHKRALALCKRLGIDTHASTTPPTLAPAPNAIRGLSIWDTAVLATESPARADQMDRETTYANETFAASGSSPYIDESLNYRIVTNGMDQITNTLAERALANGAQIHYDTRVYNVKRTSSHYTVETQVRDGHNSFRRRVFRAERVVVCVPPHAWGGWDVSKRCRSVLNAVRSESLHHIYAKGDQAPRRHVKSGLFGQRIPSQYGNDWYQVSYSAGRLADFWNRLRQSRPKDFARLLGRTARSFYWPRAFHMWRPVFNFNLKHAVRMSIEPNPTELPGLYMAGESHSSHQAWIEGALETAEMVLHRMESPASWPAAPREWVVVDGWVLDVRRWKRVHPGSAAAIENHLGENVSDLFRHILHSHNAWATVHSLKIKPN
jgi:hypothetical protein